MVKYIAEITVQSPDGKDIEKVAIQSPDSKINCKNRDHLASLVKPKTVNSEAVLLSIEAKEGITVQPVSVEIDISQSSMVGHFQKKKNQELPNYASPY